MWHQPDNSSDWTVWFLAAEQPNDAPSSTPGDVPRGGPRIAPSNSPGIAMIHKKIAMKACRSGSKASLDSWPPPLRTAAQAGQFTHPLFEILLVVCVRVHHGGSSQNELFEFSSFWSMRCETFARDWRHPSDECPRAGKPIPEPLGSSMHPQVG